jgi:hypothetical protein
VYGVVHLEVGVEVLAKKSGGVLTFEGSLTDSLELEGLLVRKEAMEEPQVDRCVLLQ